MNSERWGRRPQAPGRALPCTRRGDHPPGPLAGFAFFADRLGIIAHTMKTVQARSGRHVRG